MDPTAISQVLTAFGPTTGVIVLGLVAAVIYQTRRYEKVQTDAASGVVTASLRYEALLERSIAASTESTKAQTATSTALQELREALKLSDRLTALTPRGGG
jgi:hypothetical protein